MTPWVDVIAKSAATKQSKNANSLMDCFPPDLIRGSLATALWFYIRFLR